MASTKNFDVLTKYKCIFCEQVPGESKVLESPNGLICLNCISDGIGSELLLTKVSVTTNPLVKAISQASINSTKEACPYTEAGCGLSLSGGRELELHISECKFRPYKCVGATLNVWKCGWSGVQQDVANHLMKDHNIKPLNYFHTGHVEYGPEKSKQSIQLVDAFGKKFILYYNAQRNNRNVVFIMFLIGRKKDAQKYLIDFELKQDHRKVKFIELCYSDADELDDRIDNEQCFVMPEKLFQSYVIDGRVHFRYIIKKSQTIEEEEVKQEIHSKENRLGFNSFKAEQQRNQGNNGPGPQINLPNWGASAESLARKSANDQAEPSRNRRQRGRDGGNTKPSTNQRKRT